MKKILTALALIGLFAFHAVGGLMPETIALSYTRPAPSYYVNTNIYLTGSTVLFTNCTAYQSGMVSYTPSNVVVGPITNVVIVTNDTRVVQDLTGLSVLLRAGNTVTNFSYNCSLDNATGGTFWVQAQLPTSTQLVLDPTALGNLRIQCTLTNAAGLSYSYRGDQYLYIRTPLQY